ncbi:hypothetical protein [Gordonia crocea]|uniref:Uncharacterized protein n=1 Tax=Gordonia crocea TaxID=589162 RepID=A0A7I9V182_9ACTN|nr:hypothetical protein nbrc107697_29500 [Gordonia crocea]
MKIPDFAASTGCRALGPQVVKAYRGYAAYQHNTDRQIPLLILERRPR